MFKWYRNWKLRRGIRYQTRKLSMVLNLTGFSSDHRVIYYLSSEYVILYLGRQMFFVKQPEYIEYSNFNSNRIIQLVSALNNRLISVTFGIMRVHPNARR